MRCIARLIDRIFPEPPSDLHEQAAADEAQRVIARASGRRVADPSLEPLPLWSWNSVRAVFTMGGRFPLIRYDDEGNPRMGAGGYAIVIAAIAMCAFAKRLVHSLLTSLPSIYRPVAAQDCAGGIRDCKSITATLWNYSVQNAVEMEF